jgi:hypothetical protein|tara:strand:- start:60 stop:386 length:327 start_codon:yes stop_codon:yes gene_type:complete
MSTPLFISESIPLEIRDILKALSVGSKACWQGFEGTIGFVSDDYITLIIRQIPDEGTLRGFRDVSLLVRRCDWEELELDPVHFQRQKAYKGKINDHAGNDMMPEIDKR